MTEFLGQLWSWNGIAEAKWGTLKPSKQHYQMIISVANTCRNQCTLVKLQGSLNQVFVWTCLCKLMPHQKVSQLCYDASPSGHTSEPLQPEALEAKTLENNQLANASLTSTRLVNLVDLSIWCPDSVQTSIFGIPPFSSKTPLFGRGIPQLLRSPPRTKHGTQGTTSGVLVGAVVSGPGKLPVVFEWHVREGRG